MRFDTARGAVQQRQRGQAVVEVIGGGGHQAVAVGMPASRFDIGFQVMPEATVSKTAAAALAWVATAVTWPRLLRV